ncbi:MaoC family dehydratase [Sporomusa sp.]|uniref:MaoC family dehydratase n=1 Tax=Sporomusa sp. TaxID=2078658 RepID=UPI002CA3EA3F|nr:MaoC family dehydratase [Sporomusa sp.]MDF2874766.1 phaJ 2 [Sporomusa sp.]HWR06240.1 MaoC family dehydratase [Sporomusa sp.]
MPLHTTTVITRPYDQIEIGESASITKTITEADIVNFAGIIGDFNPIHVDEEFAKATVFGKRLAHGMLTASFISTLMGRCMPGTNGLYLSQEIKFLKPVLVGDTITAYAEIIEKIDAKRRLIIKTTVSNQRGEMVIDGKAVTMVRKDAE